MYVIQTADMERIILPSQYADELRAYPPSILSSVDAQCKRHLASWNTLDVVKRSTLHVDVTKLQLTQNLGVLCRTSLRRYPSLIRTLGRLASHLADEVDHGLSCELLSSNIGYQGKIICPKTRETWLMNDLTRLSVCFSIQHDYETGFSYSQSGTCRIALVSKR